MHPCGNYSTLLKKNNSRMENYPIQQIATIPAMEVTEIRHKNFMRLFNRRKERFKKDRLAAIGVENPTFGSQILDGKSIGNRLARKIEDATGRPRGWLDQIHDDNESVDAQFDTRLVPLISFVTAGELCEVVDLYEPGDAETWYPVRSDRVGRRAYALKVKGDSMTNPTGAPTFPHGTVIIIDPEREARPGDFVVVRLVNEPEATFKQLWEEGGQIQLRPLNPNYPRINITQEAVICGRLVGTYLEY